HGDDILEIMAAGMGYTISYIYDPASPQERAIVNDMLLLDPERKLYVRFIQDEGYMVAIGRIFSKNAEEERFPFSLESKWVTDALGKVEEVKLSGEKLFVTHRKEDGTL
ncbi:MAG: hypothetical protein GWN61_12590, partial [candidate division Zixibacteria bacterium]|nr:hypothetical protein [candidate division Zixibacteria bacterium]NIU14964.1 hypothetical protein [candidate division Zixibacteria bacterium]NIV06983.1 hypothetical protein [candidate division Zixibacteria bacterium]NIW43019.1 hypothetical protein [candidate division Zixibacteria bacterium]NIX57122.1 hypothetical protein [candidate division Zixibacteria bacterium]